MTAPLTLLRTFFVCAATTLLIACDSGGSSSSEIPEINSFNIYTANQTIYSFNEDTRISTKRAEFDSGSGQFIELDTDEGKPGFDYAVYVFENGVYLLDYDKAKFGKISKLTQYASSSTVCEIIPQKTASSAAFTDRKDSNRSTIDLPEIIIELKAGQNECNPLTNFRDRLDFSEIVDADTTTTSVLKTAGNSQSVLGGLVIDYNSVGTSLDNNDQDSEDKGSMGFLGYNLTGDLITFDYTIDGSKDSWSSSLPSDGNNLPYSKQSSTTQVVVQNSQSVYVLNVGPLFTLNSDTSDIPVQSKIDDLFAISTEDLLDTSTIETNRSQNQDTFLIKQNNTLHFFENGTFTEIPNNPVQNGTIIDFDLTSDNQALVIIENPDNSQTLLLISTTSGESTTLLTAEKVELQVILNEYFINTLELEAGSGWEAHWFRSASNVRSYANSRFLFAHDMREMNNTVLILSSDSEMTEAEMIKPAIYVFDKNRSNGRKAGVDKNNAQVDFSYGRLNTNISDIEHISIINDRYGKLIISGTNDETGAGRAVREQYYFDPSESVSSLDPEDQSLHLMNRETL